MSTERKMYEITYQIGHDSYMITDTEEIHYRIQNEPDFVHHYIESFERIPVEEIEEETFEDEVPSFRPNEKFVWTSAITDFFLEEFKLRYNDYTNPKILKKHVWEEIAIVMRKNGYNVSPEFLDRKFRKMRGTYKRRQQNGRRRDEWLYDDFFKEILQDDEDNEENEDDPLEDTEILIESPANSDLEATETEGEPSKKKMRYSVKKQLERKMSRLEEIQNIERIRSCREKIEENNKKLTEDTLSMKDKLFFNIFFYEAKDEDNFLIT